jgi:hypothetical protein
LNEDLEFDNDFASENKPETFTDAPTDNILSEYNFQTNYFGFTTVIYTLKITPRIIMPCAH